MEFRLINQTEVAIIQEIAYLAWEVAYKEILSQEQLSYMLTNFYSLEQLEKDVLEKKHLFYLLETDKPIGFICLQHDFPIKSTSRIHKLYLLPEMKGLGLGKKCIDFAKLKAIENKCNSMNLNVNKYNKAKDFYSSQGFTIEREEVIHIGNGYIMDDFVLTFQF